MLTPKAYILSAVLMLILDAIWLTLNKPMYGKLVKAIQGSDLKVSLLPAIVAYVIMYIGMVVLVIPTILASKDNSIQNVVRIAGTFGFSVYGIFNATNMAIFKNYSVTTALLDTVWGTLLYTFVAFIVVRFS